MSNCDLTLIGLYNYYPQLFDTLDLPVDVPTAIDNILSKGGEFEVLYTNPVFMSQLIGSWSSKWADTFNKWADALKIEFNPIENYDRIEETTDTNVGRKDNINKIIDTNNSTVNGTDTATSSGVNKVSGYNTNTMVDDTSSTGNTTNTNESSVYGGNTSDQEYNETHNDTNVRKSRIHGNIGVTTSVKMLTEYTDFYRGFNIYEQIADIFINDFCIRVY